MKILIASDIHGRIEATRKLEKIIQKENPEQILLLGDFLYHGPRNGVPKDLEPIEVASILNKYASKIIAVRGNCDARVDQMLLQFPLLDYQQKEINGLCCHLYHGDLKDLFTPKTGDIVISGHTHLPVLEKKEGIYYLNPGSTSFPKGGNPASFAVWENGLIQIKELNTESVLFQFSIE